MGDMVMMKGALITLAMAGMEVEEKIPFVAILLLVIMVQREGVFTQVTIVVITGQVDPVQGQADIPVRVVIPALRLREAVGSIPGHQ